MLPKILEIVVTAYQSLSSGDKPKYKDKLESFVTLNDLIGLLKSGASIAVKLKEFHDKFKLLDTETKIILSQILVTILSENQAKAVWTEGLKLLQISSDPQSCFKTSQLIDLYGINIEILVKHINSLEEWSKTNFNTRLFFELPKNVSSYPVNNQAMQFFYSSMSRLFTWITFSGQEAVCMKVISDVINKLSIKENCIFEILLRYQIQIAFGGQGLPTDIKNGIFNKNLEIKEFNTESFTLKSGNKYFYKDSQSLRFGFNLGSYFINTNFNSGKNFEWIKNGILQSDYYKQGYKAALKSICAF